MVVSVTPHDEGLSESLTSYNTELEGNAAQINGHSAWGSAWYVLLSLHSP